MDSAEIKIARRLVEKKHLKPPVNIFKLATNYATVKELYIPFEIDGISLNIKLPGHKPQIILNNNASPTRIRFTLAHELGHILIPWHVGTIIDITKESSHSDSNDYWFMELEANRFASELLMPAGWIDSVITEHKTPEQIVKSIASDADVSSQAAALRLIRALDHAHLFVIIDEHNKVTLSGRSEGTLAAKPELGTTINPKNIFPFCRNLYEFEISGNHFFWWKFDTDIVIPRSKDNRNWREILDQIVKDIGIPKAQRERFKSRINGVIAYANSQVCGDERNIKELHSACLQRIYSKEDLRSFADHPKFKYFLQDRIGDLISRPKA